MIKSLCKTDSKDVFKIISLVSESIKIIIKTNKKTNLRIDKENRIEDILLKPNEKFVYISFLIEGQHNHIYVFFDCDVDYQEFCDKKIVFHIDSTYGSQLLNELSKNFRELGEIIRPIPQ